MFGYIYLTTNKVNGKMYVGQKTSTVFLKEEYLGSGKLLSKAIDKYGRENFEVTLLEEVQGDKSNLDEREIYWISVLDAVNSDRFYNLHPGGVGGATYGNLGHKASKEKLELLRKAQIERYENNPELRNYMREVTVERFKDPREREKISNAVRELWKDPNYRKHMSDVHRGKVSPLKGKHMSEETKQKISAACKGNPSPRKGKKLTESQIESQRKSMLGRHYWNNGVENKLVHECPGEGWTLGRLPYEGGAMRDPITGRFKRSAIKSEQ